MYITEAKNSTKWPKQIMSIPPKWLKISQGPIANLTKRHKKPNQTLPSKNIGTKKGWISQILVQEFEKTVMKNNCAKK